MSKGKLKKGLYDKVLDKDLEHQLIFQDHHIVDDLKEEELDQACIEYFSNTIKKMTVSQKQQFLLKRLETDKLKKLVAIEDDSHKAIYPDTKFDDVALFTGSNNEPTLMNEFKKELMSTDTFKMLVSFVKKSGIAPIIDDLKYFTDRGGKLQVITTTYTQASDFEAIMDLANLDNTEVKISYDVNTTRLHAKSYLFLRDTGLNSAYIGSSNFSHPAMNRGLEWNVKLTTKNNYDAIFKFQDKFDQYWNSNEFELLDINDDKSVDKLKKELKQDIGSIHILSDNIKPFNYQEHLLQQLQTDRNRGNNRNLLVAATGTGKTVIAAFDFKRYLYDNKDANILFIAHRKEIIDQALKTYRAILGDYNFGNILDGDNKPKYYKNLFSTIQSAIRLDDNILNTFDYIVIDEVHHIGAESYDKIYDLNPNILLGLTATPFRSDNKDVLSYFNDKPAAELNLIDAINDKMLSPFNYFGVSDSVDLSNISVVRGKYNVEQLDEALMNSGRIDHIINSIIKYTKLDEVRCIGFCASINHANYMADKFRERNLKAIAITSNSDKEIRKTIASKLKNKEYQFVFTVDIFNEGVDIPSINTVLFLRPTNSAIIYLQQLGRGLRLDPSKDVLTVLDFIGHNNKDFKFADNLRHILMDRNISRQVKDNTFVPPRGCEIVLERQAREHILDNIKSIQGSIAKYYKNLYDQYITKPSLEEFFIDNNVNIYEFYSKTYLSYIRGVASKTGKQNLFTNLINNNDSSILITIKNILEGRINLDDMNKLPEFEYLTIQVALRGFISGTGIKVRNITSNELCDLIKDYKVEMLELINYMLKYHIFEEGDYIDSNVPLKKNCKYSKLQIKSAYNRIDQPANEGVTSLEEYNNYLIYVTLIKNEKRTLMGHDYEDEILGSNNFRWISDGSGKREINIISKDYTPVLFIRLKDNNEYGSSEFFEVIGKCSYIKHIDRDDKNKVFEYKIDGLLPSYNMNV